jgi:quercetin dioxygenase-like cupin family protein
MGCGITNALKKHPKTRENVLEDISINYVGAGILAKQVILMAGMEVIQHKHVYDHLAVLVYGKVTVITDDWKQDFEGPASLVIEKGINHAVVAHTDSLWICIHATQDMEDLIA